MSGPAYDVHKERGRQAVRQPTAGSAPQSLVAPGRSPDLRAGNQAATRSVQAGSGATPASRANAEHLPAIRFEDDFRTVVFPTPVTPEEATRAIWNL